MVRLLVEKTERYGEEEEIDYKQAYRFAKMEKRKEDIRAVA